MVFFILRQEDNMTYFPSFGFPWYGNSHFGDFDMTSIHAARKRSQKRRGKRGH